jgi:hypothetical protein
MASKIIKIREIETYNPRSDRKPYWFRVDNDIYSSYALSKLPGNQCWVFICLIGMANKSKERSVPFDSDYISQQTRVPKKEVESAIKALVDNGTLQIIEQNGTVANHAENQLEPSPHHLTPNGDKRGQMVDYETDRQTDITDGTDETVSEPSSAPNGFTPKELAELWNRDMSTVRTTAGEPMPLVALNRFKSHHARFKLAQKILSEAPEIETWLQVIDRIAKSDFCRGKNDRGWIADFDWLIKPDSAKSPATFAKVLEGKYDNRKVQQTTSSLHQLASNMAQRIQYAIKTVPPDSGDLFRSQLTEEEWEVVKAAGGRARLGSLRPYEFPKAIAAALSAVKGFNNSNNEVDFEKTN